MTVRLINYSQDPEGRNLLEQIAYCARVSNPAYYFNFTVNLPKQSGDTVYGDFCEYNDSEQLERVISPYMNKFSYNQALFTTDLTTNQTNPNGYYYQVHFPVRIKTFSNYIETAHQYRDWETDRKSVV